MHQVSEESDILCELIIRGKVIVAVEGTDYLEVEEPLINFSHRRTQFIYRRSSNMADVVRCVPHVRLPTVIYYYYYYYYYPLIF